METKIDYIAQVSGQKRPYLAAVAQQHPDIIDRIYDDYRRHAIARIIICSTGPEGTGKDES
jgi:hypothetical protein